MPPPASSGQVRQPLLEAAVEYWPAVLVTQGQCQDLLHEEAGARDAAVGVGGLEHRGTNGGVGGHETVGCMINAQKAGNRGGAGAVHGVDGALSRLCMEAERYYNILKYILYLFTDTQADTTQSSEAKPCIHNNAHLVSTDITSKPSQTAARNRLPIIVASGHRHASPEPGTTRLSKHP
jgi:hypothetical protein